MENSHEFVHGRNLLKLVMGVKIGLINEFYYISLPMYILICLFDPQTQHNNKFQ